MSTRWDGAEATSAGQPATTVEAGPQRPNATPPPDAWHRQGARGALTGTVLGDYEIGGVLGEGGMGTVYRAWQRSLGRKVAVKTLAGGDDPLHRARFESEARAASLVQSPHVVAVYAAGSWDGTGYFVMEFVAGSDLGRLIAEHRGGLPQARVLELAAQAARGLVAAAARGVVHRDIKPGNLLLSEDGTLKIADFGVSKIAGDRDLTRTGSTVGTPSYIAPEQSRGETADARSDIYALGCVLYEAATGAKPFAGENSEAVIWQHNYAEPRRPRELRPDLPESLEAVILRCMQKDPGRRYADAAALLADIEATRAGQLSVTAILAARLGTGAETEMRRRLGRRHRWALPLAAGLLAAAGVGGALLWRSGTAEARAESSRRAELLRDRLHLALDAVHPPPAGADDDLAGLAALVGAADADVARWQAKLARVRALETALAGVRSGALPDAGAAQAARLAADELAALVGGDAAAVQRTAARLAECAAEATRLRQLAAELDGDGSADLALAERLAPAVAELTRLAGDEDADASRWRRRLHELTSRADGLRQAIAAALAGKPGEAAAERAASALDELARLRGRLPPDAAELGWRTALAGVRGEVARLRARLAALDGGQQGEAALTRLADDLEAYAALVLPDDAALLRWRAAHETAASRLADLLAAAASMAAAAPSLPVAELAAGRARLDELRGLLQSGDARLAAPAAALAAADAALAAWRADLAAACAADTPTRAVLARGEAALAALAARAAEPPAELAAAAARLAGAARSHAALRARCAAADRPDLQLDADLAEAVLAWQALVEPGDAEAQRWHARVIGFVELRRRLGVLDRAAPLPGAVDADLAALAALVAADDAQLASWRAKVARVRTLAAALAALDAIAPPPADAEARLDELSALTGPPVQAPAWRAKLARLRAAEARCAALLGTASVQRPADAEALIAAVEAETGPTPATAGWRARAAELAGPGAPPWATAYQVDARGPRAQIALPGGPAIAFRRLPPGLVLLGSPPGETGRGSDETPVRLQRSAAVWIAECETSRALAAWIDGSTAPRDPDLPVTGIDWPRAAALCQRFGERIGATARLPHEVEWEQACRAAGADPAVDGRDRASLDAAAWYRAASGDAAHGVGALAPNPLGLHDLLGNVWEWCQDGYAPYPADGTIDHLGVGARRVLRGGGWGDPAEHLRAANRAALDPAVASAQIGCRIVIEEAPLPTQASTSPVGGD